MKKLCVCFAAAALAAVSLAGQPDEKVSAPQLPGRSETNVVIKIKDKGEFSDKSGSYLDKRQMKIETQGKPGARV